jgi:putative queuosine salvage protein
VTLVDEIRAGAAWVSARARLVRVEEQAVRDYARALPGPDAVPALDPHAHVVDGALEERAAFYLTLDAINFGSGWFPTLRKRDGRSGYFTIALGLRERFAAAGPWSAAELAALSPPDLAAALHQEPGHELMALFAASLRDLGERVRDSHGGRFEAVVAQAGGSAVSLVEELATWSCFADVSAYEGRAVPFFKRAQISASDLALAGVGEFGDLHRLTLFADNLIPHVLRVDGLLRFDPGVAARIDAGELLRHGSPEEVEMRAGAIHVAELVCRERADLTPQMVDQLLWARGGGERYKALPRPRARTTAY